MPIISNDISAGSVATPASGNTTLFTDAGQAYIKQASGTVLPIGGLTPSGVTAGSYTLCNLTVDTNGVITTAASGGSGDITTALGYTPGTGSVTDVSVVTANGISGSIATSTTTPAITLSLGNITPSDISMTGDLTINSTKKIKGDFSSSPSGGRTVFQSTTSNAKTLITAIPNGTVSGTGGVAGFTALSTTDLVNNSYLIQTIVPGLSYSYIQSGANGTGTVLPLKLLVGASGSGVTIDSSHNLVAGGTITGKLITTNTVPATSTATGIAGMIAYDSSYVYICTATNTWVRAATATW
jgi:hypothetical protein